MPNLNSTHLIGHLAGDPTGRDAGNSYVCNFRIAVKDGYGEKAQTDWISCVAWGNKARLLVEQGGKGDIVELCGKIKTRSYEKNDGTKVYVTEVRADALSITKSKKEKPVDDDFVDEEVPL